MPKSIIEKKQYLPAIFTSQSFPVHWFSQLQTAMIVPPCAIASIQLPCTPHGLGLHELVALKENK